MAASWTCHAARDLPLDTDAAWDGAAAQKAMLDAANIGGENPNVAQARRGFLLVDDSAKELRGSYSLPFCTIKSGTLTALISGCRAAASRLPQKDGVADGERSKARAALDAYFAKANADQKKSRSDFEGLDGETFRFPFSLLPPEERAKAAVGGDPETLMKLARQRAGDPAIFDEFPPYFFPAAVSTNKLDSYYTQMHRSSLSNFADDLNRGVSFLDSHDTRKLPIGYSLQGNFTGPGGNGVMRTVGDFMSLPATPDMQAFIQKARAGAVQDVSSGFFLGEAGRYVCDLCGNDIGRGAVCHWPGMSYEVDGKERMATATIHDARLAEVSAVYDGATPGAMILKAQRMAEAGLLVPEVARRLERCYRTRLAGADHLWAGAELRSPEEEKPMPEDPKTPETPPPAASPFGTPALRALMEAAGLTPGESDDHNLRTLTEAVRKLPEYEKERERLAVLADYGTKYRAQLIEDTLAEGVRAFGSTFPKEQRRQGYENTSIEQIKGDLDLWKPLGDAVLAGGRTSVDQGEPDPNGGSKGFVTPTANPAHFRA